MVITPLGTDEIRQICVNKSGSDILKIEKWYYYLARKKSAVLALLSFFFAVKRPLTSSAGHKNSRYIVDVPKIFRSAHSLLFPLWKILIWLHFDYILDTFQLHFSYILVTFLTAKTLHKRYILATFLTAITLHQRYVLATFRLILATKTISYIVDAPKVVLSTHSLLFFTVEDFPFLYFRQKLRESRLAKRVRKKCVIP